MYFGNDPRDSYANNLYTQLGELEILESILSMILIGEQLFMNIIAEISLYPLTENFLQLSKII